MMALGSDSMRAAALLLAIGVAGCGASYAASPVTPVEVWSGAAHDGLTQRLIDALEGKLKLSHRFTLSYGKKPGTLLVTFPNSAGWTKNGDRLRVSYTAEFSTVDGEPLGSVTASCSDDKLQECAEHVLMDAQAAADKMQ